MAASVCAQALHLPSRSRAEWVTKVCRVLANLRQSFWGRSTQLRKKWCSIALCLLTSIKSCSYEHHFCHRDTLPFETWHRITFWSDNLNQIDPIDGEFIDGTVSKFSSRDFDNLVPFFQVNEDGEACCGQSNSRWRDDGASGLTPGSSPVFFQLYPNSNLVQGIFWELSHPVMLFCFWTTFFSKGRI